ncbi:hypothetical protein [Oricola nitratireducens]|uniref:hypothetical protein n=1 Tax=Oricola nitratireducens TaxID=2775868 RepID=UPI0018694D40|nr:hypothetical protein [Oricola nitratireducens]
MSECFKAGVQYDDWIGEAAADDDINNSVHALLRERGLMKEGQSLVSVEIYMENAGNPPQVYGYLINAKDADEAHKALSKIDKPQLIKVGVHDLSIEDVTKLFKRLNVVLSRRDLSLIGREFDILE